nr:MAG TPA: hypothetical protein [Caudoviricetes sp.]
MQFKDIKQGQPVFILDKSEMTINQGKVVNNVYHVDSNNNFGSVFTQQNNTMCRDITIESNGKSNIYVISELLEIAKAGNIVLSTSSEALTKEINDICDDAKEKLANREYYQMIVNKTPELLVTLNPALKKEQETETRLKAVEGSVQEVKDLVKTLVEKLS